MFSISAGYALNPPMMNMSFMRSVMRRLPRSSSTPTSPVCSQPSASMASAVRFGIVDEALHHVVAADRRPRRARPRGSALPSSSTTCTSVPGMARRPSVCEIVSGVVVVAAHRRDAGRLGEPVAASRRSRSFSSSRMRRISSTGTRRRAGDREPQASTGRTRRHADGRGSTGRSSAARAASRCAPRRRAASPCRRRTPRAGRSSRP